MIRASCDNDGNTEWQALPLRLSESAARGLIRDAGAIIGQGGRILEEGAGRIYKQ